MERGEGVCSLFHVLLFSGLGIGARYSGCGEGGGREGALNYKVISYHVVLYNHTVHESSIPKWNFPEWQYHISHKMSTPSCIIIIVNSQANNNIPKLLLASYMAGS